MAETKGGPPETGETHSVVVNLRERGWVSIAQLASLELKPVDWIVQGIMARGAVSVLSGPPRSIKSWFMMHTALCCACGTPVLGTFHTKRCSVMILQLEESLRQLHRKFHYLTAGGAFTSNQLLDSVLYARTGRLFKVMNPESRKSFLEEFREILPDILFVDSLKRIHNTSENDDTWVSAFMDWTMELRNIKEDVHVCAVHHHRKSQEKRDNEDVGEMLRGHGDLLASVDAHIAFRRKGKGGSGIYTATHDKNRDGAEMMPFLVELHVLDAEGKAFLKHGGSAAEDDVKSETTEVGDVMKRIAEYFGQIEPNVEVSAGDVARVIGVDRGLASKVIAQMARSGDTVRFSKSVPLGIGNRMVQMYRRITRPFVAGTTTA